MSGFVFGELELDGNNASIAFSVPENLKYLEGHFPGNPIVPGVAQVVALAETQARTVWPELGDNAGLRRLKFMVGLYPGDQLRLTLKRGESDVAFRVYKADAECSRGTLLFAS